MHIAIDKAKESIILNAIRFPLVCMVVLIHCKTSNENRIGIWKEMSGNDFCDSIQVVFSSILSPPAVPIFFLISGYYFFYNTKQFTKKIYYSKLKKRIRTLLTPYIIWNCIFILKYIVIKIIVVIKYDKDPLLVLGDFMEQYKGFHMFWDCYVWTTNNNFFGLINTINNSAPILFPLWFV